MGWLYVPGQPDSSSESLSRLPGVLAASCTSSGERKPLRFWSLACRRDAFTALLSGATCEPSTQQRGVDAFISSLPDFRANRSASPASAESASRARPTSDGSGPSSESASSSASPRSSSSRTSTDSSGTDSRTSSETFEAWALSFSKACARRRRLALRTSGNGSSSSESTESGGGGSDGRARSSDLLPTPMASHADHRPAATPSTHSMSGRCLGAQVRHGFPCLRRSRSTLRTQAARWPTPVTTDREDSARHTIGADRSSHSGTMLLDAVRMWDPESSEIPGPADGQLALNPAFVDFLMGWPGGWTELPIASENPASTSAATGSSRSKPRSRSGTASKRSRRLSSHPDSSDPAPAAWSSIGS